MTKRMVACISALMLLLQFMWCAASAVLAIFISGLLMMVGINDWTITIFVTLCMLGIGVVNGLGIWSITRSYK